jgi:acyl-CoA synthetase (NDP forming)
MVESAGVYVAHSLGEACAAVARGRRLQSRRHQGVGRVLVLSYSGGCSVLQSNALADVGLALPGASDALTRDVQALFGRPMTNPFDLAGAGDGDLGVFVKLVEAGLRHGGYDALVLAFPFGSFGYFGAEWEADEMAAVEGLLELTRTYDTPMVVWSPIAARPGLTAVQRLRAGGLSCVEWPEEAATIVAAALFGRRGRALSSLPAAKTDAPPMLDAGLSEATDRTIDALEAHDVAHAIGRIVTRTECEAIRDGRWVLRLDGFVHKAKVGAVKVGVPAAELIDAYDALCDVAKRYGVTKAIRLGPFVPHEEEMLVTFWRDARQGSGCAIGAGGVRAEETRDVAVGTIVRTEDDVTRMLERSEVGRRVLADGQLLPPTIDIILRLASAFTESLDVGELECNPIALGAGGASVLDVLPS